MVKKYCIRLVDNPQFVLTSCRFGPSAMGNNFTVNFGSLLYEAEPFLLPSESAAFALASLIQSYYPDGDSIIVSDVDIYQREELNG